jgi:phospholipase D
MKTLFILVIFYILPVFADINPSYSVCFTPPHKQCGHFISNHINQAKESIYVQAYGFTHTEIIDSLIEAKKRGVIVEIILDSSNFLAKKLAFIEELKRLGIKIHKAKVSGIAHNKVMVIDKKKVITGSFNFTESADKRNAENVLIVVDKRLANKYLANWKNLLTWK